ncbi:MAG: hypothetical protein ACK45B_10915, partial [Limisphaerales bacterium]
PLQPVPPVMTRHRRGGASPSTAVFRVNACYFRTHDGLECDLVLETGRELELIEIKLTTSPAPEDFTRLAKVGALLQATRLVLLTRTSHAETRGERWSVNLTTYLDCTA